MPNASGTLFDNVAVKGGGEGPPTGGRAWAGVRGGVRVSRSPEGEAPGGRAGLQSRGRSRSRGRGGPLNREGVWLEGPVRRAAGLGVVGRMSPVYLAAAPGTAP